MGRPKPQHPSSGGPRARKLHLLDSFHDQGSDGKPYKVCGLEHLVRDDGAVDGVERWESTAVSEYRLAYGRRVDMQADGSMQIQGSEIRLTQTETRSA